MENKVYKLKEKLIGKIEDEMQDMNRLDVDKVAMLIDAVHHLAETEYYCSIADSMWADKHGYSGGGTGSSTPISQVRSGYMEQPVRSSYMPQHMGYMPQDPMEAMREKLRNSSPDERERLKRDAMQMFGMM